MLLTYLTLFQKWRELVRDGKNWRHLNLFSFQVAVEVSIFVSKFDARKSNDFAVILMAPF